jgi:hypothetical protein
VKSGANADPSAAVTLVVASVASKAAQLMTTAAMRGAMTRLGEFIYCISVRKRK